MITAGQHHAQTHILFHRVPLTISCFHDSSCFILFLHTFIKQTHSNAIEIFNLSFIFPFFFRARKRAKTTDCIEICLPKRNLRKNSLVLVFVYSCIRSNRKSTHFDDFVCVYAGVCFLSIRLS